MKPLGYALIGCGSFGQFCLDQYQSLAEVQLLAAVDSQTQVLERVQRQFGIDGYQSVDDMLRRPDVELVHVATPPSTHHGFVMQALAAGKHVLCEKPLATTMVEADQMLQAAAAVNKVLVVNLIMRYDPLTPAVKRIVHDKLLGEPVRVLLENYATDQRLKSDHWFWDPKLSGGIFIEHGVHFFDLFEMWFGKTTVVSARQMPRPGAPALVDQVECSCSYEPGVLANFYHGFTQSDHTERQEFRLLFERGELVLREWLPTSLRITAALRDSQAEAIVDVLPNGKIRRREAVATDKRSVYSHGKTYDVDAIFTIEADAGRPKTELYGHVLRELLLDQVRYIRDQSNQRTLREDAGRRSLEIAIEATERATLNAGSPRNSSG